MSAPFASCCSPLLFRAGLLFSLACLFPCRMCWASGPDETIPPAEVLVDLEHRADQADAREKCFLYTQVLHSLTELEGREIGSGDETAAASTLSQIDRVATKLKAVETKDAKRLKNAEGLLEHTARRLGDMLHLASGQERAAMKSTLDKLNGMHEELLALVFAK